MFPYGDHRAFDRLVHEYQSVVRRFLLNLTLGDEALADDLAQDTFLRAWQGIGQYRGEAHLQTWLLRIAYNVFYDHRRRNSRTEAIPMDYSAPVLRTLQAREPSEATAIDVRRAMAVLSSDERSCVTLQMIDGEPIDSIAEITGMPANTVKSHLRRGKEKLKIFLKQNGYDGK